jgi:peptidoglycan/LPS O-acetylase OafA/YrhL
MSNVNVSERTGRSICVFDRLDFCKGVAILGIFLVHWRPAWFGWQGVSVFIVLSGFGLTHARLERSKIAWKDWYLKRFRRILPSYWVVSLCGYLTLVGLYWFQRESLSIALRLPLDLLFKTIFLLDVVLLSPFVKLDPNGALWFVPFIIGFYLAFPILFKGLNRLSLRGSLIVGLGMMSVQWLYTAVMIYWFDGLPLGFGHYATWFPVLGVPFDRLPPSVLFQGMYPFTIFLARLGELGLGMMGAIVLNRHNHKFHQVLLNPWAGIAGGLIWLMGNALIFRGFWGWIFADFVIALGLIVGLLNLSAFVQQKLPLLFAGMQTLSVWSYHIFLTHFLIIFIFQRLDEFFMPMVQDSWVAMKALRVLGLLCMIFFTGVAAGLLRRFDRSQVADLMFQQTVVRLFKIGG